MPVIFTCQGETLSLSPPATVLARREVGRVQPTGRTRAGRAFRYDRGVRTERLHLALRELPLLEAAALLRFVESTCRRGLEEVRFVDESGRARVGRFVAEALELEAHPGVLFGGAVQDAVLGAGAQTVRLVLDVSPLLPGLLFAARFDDSLEADTALGSPAFEAGDAVRSTSIRKFGAGALEGTSGRYARYRGEGNAPAGRGCVRFWMRFAALPAETNAALVCLGNENDDQGKLLFELTAGGTLQLKMYHASGALALTAGFSWTPTLETWYHLCFSWDVTDQWPNLFVDGAKQTLTAPSGAMPARAAATAKIFLGHAGTGSPSGLFGHLDSLEISDAPLAADFSPPDSGDLIQ